MNPYPTRHEQYVEDHFDAEMADKQEDAISSLRMNLNRILDGLTFPMEKSAWDDLKNDLAEVIIPNLIGDTLMHYDTYADEVLQSLEDMAA